MSENSDSWKRLFDANKVKKLTGYYTIAADSNDSTEFMDAITKYSKALFDGFEVSDWQAIGSSLDGELRKAFSKLKFYNDYIDSGESADFYFKDSNYDAYAFIICYNEAKDTHASLDTMLKKVNIPDRTGGRDSYIFSLTADKYYLTIFHQWLVEHLKISPVDLVEEVTFNANTSLLYVNGKDIGIVGKRSKAILGELFASDDKETDSGEIGTTHKKMKDTVNKTINPRFEEKTGVKGFVVVTKDKIYIRHDLKSKTNYINYDIS